MQCKGRKKKRQKHLALDTFLCAHPRGVSAYDFFFTHCTVRWRTIYREACCNGGVDCEWGPLEELLFTVPYDIFHSALWACLAGWAGWGQERKKKKETTMIIIINFLTHQPPGSLLSPHLFVAGTVPCS